MSTVFPISVPTKRLAASIAPTDTSFRVSDILGWDGNALTSANFGTLGLGCFRDTNGTVLELFSFDPSTIGASQINFINRGLNFQGDYSTPVVNNELIWVKGTTLVELGTNTPQMWQFLKDYIDGIAIAGAPNASSSAKGIVQIATAAQINAGTATGSTGAALAITPDQLALSNIGLGIIPSGGIIPYSGLTVPTGFLAADGSAVSRATFPNLFAALSKAQTFTVTIASPAVFSATAHGLVAGNRIYLTTTGGLPSGLASSIGYYVIATGLTTNAFEVALAPGGAAVNTTGSQSGVHTFTFMPHGGGNGTTTFNVPDRRDRTIVGASAAAPTKVATIVSIAGNVMTVSGLSPNSNNEFATGTPVVFGAVTAGNLVNATTYYLVRVSSSTFSVATTLANALLATPTVITLLGTEAGTFTATYTARNLGETGGEENHSENQNELSAHTHTTAINGTSTGGNGFTSSSASVVTSTITSSSTGGNVAASIMMPFGVDQFIIKT